MSKAVLVAAVGLLFRLALLALVLSPPRLKVSAGQIGLRESTINMHVHRINTHFSIIV